MKFAKPLIAVIVLALVAGAGWWLGQRRQSSPQTPAQTASAAAADNGRKVLYWYDPMKPEVHFQHPGPSPLMPSMQLQPKYADGAAGGGISVDPRMAENLGMRVAAVERGDFARRINTVGQVAIDQNRIIALTARAKGWIERLGVRAVGDPVQRGQTFAEIYAPQLLATQEELLLARRNGNKELAAAARQRLTLFGVPESMIDKLMSSGRAQRDVPVVSPIDGVLTELKVREGDPVDTGMALAQIADLSQVWIEVQVPEAQAGLVAVGDAAVVTLQALPGRLFKARVAYVYPDLQAVTRSLRVRLEVDNPGLALKPGMYARVMLSAMPQRDVLLVPDQAIIDDGRRKLVFLAESDGRYRPRYVRLGADDGHHSVVLEGLQQGDRIVVSGQFLLDAEANLTGTLQYLGAGNGGSATDADRTAPQASPAEHHPASTHSGTDQP